MKVVIVAKTRTGAGACIGAISFEGESLRLEAADAGTNEFAGLEYEVGDVWEIRGRPAKEVVAPHVENFIVAEKRKLPPMDDPAAFIRRHMPPIEGSYERLYDGLTGATKTGTLYISEADGVPPNSTMFWKPDKTLVRDEGGKRIRYRYPTADGGRTITFVGFQVPPESIEAGTLLRVSLAHWWRPSDKPEAELRCYVQLSGWFPLDTEYRGIEFSPLPRGADDHWLEKTQIENPVLTASPLEAEPDLERAVEVLNTVFGFDSFWPHQEEIITNLLKRKDTLAIMPTGSGKSLCYQLPALLSPGLTVVVSPLIALMQDQVDQLRFLGVPAVYLNSTLTYSEYLQNVSKIKKGEVELLYIAPETLLRPETMVLLEQCDVNYLTVDEAHCISSWGHDFRPEYRRLIDVRKRLPAATCFALTATATSRVREDIKKQLGMHSAEPIVASFDRKNLFLEVRPKSDGWNQLLTFLEAHRNQAGIIYCATRRQVDLLAADLADEGWSAVPYHAGLESEERLQNQRLFAHDKVEIVVATIAFGMGIDKPNVRFVVHYDTPKNLESYYQQIGRAGRDGFAADCLFLFSWQDITTIKWFIRESPAHLQKGEYQRVDKLIEFAESNQCRRKVLLAYFGERYHADNCQACDICLSSEDIGDLVDATEEARKFISCVKETGEIFGSTHIISVLRGSKSKKVMKFHHNQITSYDSGREHSTRDWTELANQFIKQELLVREISHGSLKLTPRSYSVLKGEKVLISKIEDEERRPRREEGIEFDADLFDQLRKKRNQLADEAGVPSFVIFHDRSLQEMALYYPQTRESFSEVYGVGRAKLENFAGELLPIIKAYCGAKRIAEVPRRKKRKRISRKPRNRSDEVAAEYNKGVPAADIARSMNIKTSTLIRHLWHCAQQGQIHSVDGLQHLSQLDDEKKRDIFGCFNRLGAEFLRPVFDELKGEISYDELRILQISYLVSSQQQGSK